MTTAGWSGFWNHVYEGGHSFSGRSLVPRRSAIRALNGYGRRAYNALVSQLVGGNVGGSATHSYTRVEVQDVTDSTTLGGVRGVETETVIDRVTTAEDITNITEDLAYANSPTWPEDASGNGGGGKGGY